MKVAADDRGRFFYKYVVYLHIYYDIYSMNFYVFVKSIGKQPQMLELENFRTV